MGKIYNLLAIMQTFSLSTEFVRMWGLFNTRIVVTQRFFFLVIGGGISVEFGFSMARHSLVFLLYCY